MIIEKRMRYLLATIIVIISFLSCDGERVVKDLGDDDNIEQGDKEETISDEEIMDIVQSQTFKYFWDYAHPTSGMARERSNGDGDIVTTGGTGFGLMSLIVGVERNYITREQALDRLLKITDFLKNKTTRYHGAWAHWVNGRTGITKPFSPKDNGGDLVETSFLVQGLLTVKQYFTNNTEKENLLVERIDELCDGVEWDWYTNGTDHLIWHWSENYNWDMNLPIKGFNECMITYVLAVSSKNHAIAPELYHSGWAGSNYARGMNISRTGYTGGPLFFTHYSYLGLNPKITDKYIKASRFDSYFERNKEQSLINKQYCVDQKNKYDYYGEDCWGLTASDDPKGYMAHNPSTNGDNGTISPTAAISSIVYTPEESLKVMKHLYTTYKDKGLWGKYGFKDAFNVKEDWFASSYLAIDQGPIVVMIENYRSGLLWNLFMKNEEVKQGLNKCGIELK